LGDSKAVRDTRRTPFSALELDKGKGFLGFWDLKSVNLENLKEKSPNDFLLPRRKP